MLNRGSDSGIRRCPQVTPFTPGCRVHMAWRIPPLGAARPLVTEAAADAGPAPGVKEIGQMFPKSHLSILNLSFLFIFSFHYLCIFKRHKMGWGWVKNTVNILNSIYNKAERGKQTQLMHMLPNPHPQIFFLRGKLSLQFLVARDIPSVDIFKSSLPLETIF